MEAIVNARIVVRGTKLGILLHCQTPALALKWWFMLLLILSFSIPSWAGLCPQGCQCENKGLFTICPTGELKHIPHFLNPAIKQLKINGNRITKLEGALNFYDKVIIRYEIDESIIFHLYSFLAEV